MNKKRVFINSIMAVVQVIIVGLTYLFLYKFLLNKIGIEKLGIWSLILATISVANISNMGLSSSIVKFVAKYHARDEYDTIIRLIQTAFVSIAIVLGIICIIAYPVINSLLNILLPSQNIAEAKAIIPFALISLWLTGISGIYLSGIDGLQHTYFRSILLSASNILYFIICIILVPKYELMGLAYAQVIQYIVLIIAAFLSLRYYLHLSVSLLPKWDKKLFKEMFDYGVNFQVISLTTMLYEPVTKALLTKFGGLASVGFYEMACRMVLQVRALLVNANNALVSTIAFVHEKDTESVKRIYIKSFQFLLFLALPIFSFLIAFTPIISELWIGYYAKEFVLFSVMLSIGWFINMLNAPAYFIYLGTGELKWDLISHISIAILNGLLGYVLGSYFNGLGVVFGWIIALILGSLIIMVSYHLKEKIDIRNIVSNIDIFLIAVALLYSILSLVVYSFFRSGMNLTIIALIIFTFSFMFFPVILKHPFKSETLKLVQNLFVNG